MWYVSKRERDINKISSPNAVGYQNVPLSAASVPQCDNDVAQRRGITAPGMQEAAGFEGVWQVESELNILVDGQVPAGHIGGAVNGTASSSMVSYGL